MFLRILKLTVKAASGIREVTEVNQFNSRRERLNMQLVSHLARIL